MVCRCAEEVRRFQRARPPPGILDVQPVQRHRNRRAGGYRAVGGQAGCAGPLLPLRDRGAPSESRGHRLHDIGRSGWFTLIGFIPLLGGIALLVVTCTEGDAAPNAYGPSPKPVPAHL
ncbi:hypothetical protein SCOCK_630025 [Actinacidiphila cocklensis]|uniref:DUF805 domain-containing protein n=1 Tax=Actinacidiphila cocklensis TaxID=887465 RepID=A0A9W4GWU5_9ACTN|nr:hypothetical protein SCOCK_630025 [Actinacidiphila cocklensis]